VLLFRYKAATCSIFLSYHTTIMSLRIDNERIKPWHAWLLRNEMRTRTKIETDDQDI
jgi:hypothetical protein